MSAFWFGCSSRVYCMVFGFWNLALPGMSALSSGLFILLQMFLVYGLGVWALDAGLDLGQ
jgi:hypothetical protein